MAQPYIGEIRLFGGLFAISGWSFCNGSLLPISQNPALFQLLGTTYGGDGVNTFAIPDLQGRVPVHQGQGAGQNYVIGQKSGVETVTLTTAQLPSHPHGALGSARMAGVKARYFSAERSYPHERRYVIESPDQLGRQVTGAVLAVEHLA